jgi:hypothetical protein
VLDRMVHEVRLEALVDNGNLHHLSLTLAYRISKISSLKTFLLTFLVSSSAWQDFNPFGDIVNYYQDVLDFFGFWEWSHVVNSLDIKELDLHTKSFVS